MDLQNQDQTQTGAAPETELLPQGEPTELAAAAGDDEPFVWQASEYVHHDKSTSWYIYLGLGILALLILAVVTKQWFSIAVFAAMAGAIVVYARKPPRTITYRLDLEGITIEEKLYPFAAFTSFSVLPDHNWHTIDLEPTRRFMPRLTVLFSDESFDEIVARLERQLPRVDREPDMIEKVTRHLRF